MHDHCGLYDCIWPLHSYSDPVAGSRLVQHRMPFSRHFRPANSTAVRLTDTNSPKWIYCGYLPRFRLDGGLCKTYQAPARI